MSTPELLMEILKHSPGLGVGLLIGWYAVRIVRGGNDAHIASLKAEHALHLATKDAVIARLDAEIVTLRKERDKWLRAAMKRDKP